MDLKQQKIGKQAAVVKTRDVTFAISDTLEIIKTL
jgi:hypothetical protein